MFCDILILRHAISMLEGTVGQRPDEPPWHFLGKYALFI